MAVILTVTFYAAAPKLLQLFGASVDTLPFAVEYSRIYILGAIAVLIVMEMNPFLTTQGFAKMSMVTTILGAGINIILDPIFIFVFDLGVAGAAYATVLSQMVSALWILKFLTGKQTLLRLKVSNMPLQKDIILPCLGLGVSSFVMISTESILSISFTSSLAKFGGDVAVGAMTVLKSIMQLVTMLLTGIFTSAQALVDYAAWAIRIYMAGIFATGFQMSCQQAFLALGQAKISLFMACLRKIILLIPLIFLLPLFFEQKAMAVFLAEPIADIIAATVTTYMFFRFFGKFSKA